MTNHLILLFYISTIFGILPIIYYYLKEKTLTNEIDVFVPILWLSFFSSVYEFFFSYLLNFDSEYWFRFYMLLEYLSIYYFYFKIFKKQKEEIKHLNISLLIYLIFYLFQLKYWKHNDNLLTDSFLSVFNTITVLYFSIKWFQNIFSNFEIKNLLDSPIFMITAAMLIYYTSTVFFFLYSHYIFKSNDYNLLEFWQINIVLVIVFRFFLILGIKKSIKS